MFSKKDIKVFDTKIEELEDIADELTEEINKSSIQEQKEILKVIEKFIKEKKLIIYGGNAQNLAIKRISPKDVFYNDNKVHDFDVYSYDPINHMIELAKRIYNLGFKNIIAIEAIHIETYSLKYYGTALCDMSYMPKYIFDNLQYYIVDGLKIINPYFTYIDFMRMFNDPLTSSSFRWSKNFERYNIMQEYYPLKSKELKNNNLFYIFNKLQEFYPIKPKEYKNEKLYDISDDILNFFNDKIKKSTTLFYTGFIVYNEYAKLSKTSEISINYLTLISSNFINDVNSIISDLKKKFKNNITTDERYPFFQFWDHSVDIRYKNKIICKIYGNNNICIPYKEINKIKYTTFTFNLMWFMIEKFYYSIYKADCNGKPSNYKEIEQGYDDIIKGMLFMKEKFLKEKKKTFLDDTLFQHFVVDKCSGTPKNPGEIRKEMPGYKGFKFDPSKQKNNTLDFSYTNISGRFIIKNENKIIK